MHKWGSVIILLLTVFVAACSQSSTSSTTDKDYKKEVTSQQEDTEQSHSQDNNPEGSEQEERDKKIEETKQDGIEKDQEAVEEETEPKYKVTKNWSIKPIGDANEKVVLLTIDDAPDQYGLEMAKTLKKLDAPAIFFVNGHFIDTKEEKDTLKKIHEMGFTIGNHTMNHKALKVNGNPISQDVQKEEIMKLSDLIEEITGERPRFFRAPHGLNTDYAMELAKQEKMKVMNWSFGYDWNKEYMTEEAIADIMVNTPYLGNGSNLLVHDREWTAKALEDIVKGLRDKGYEFVNPEEIQTP